MADGPSSGIFAGSTANSSSSNLATVTYSQHSKKVDVVSSGVRMAMSPQQFCLRWNNHQSNIISVFEQLLQTESFVDVTLAVEGMSLKAHKVVLSACSPYFQAVLASHPDKHPIVILKDVRYTDMRDLLDFMYRGEVSVDQDNLSGFLRVAESLRIKGLTEVNEKKRLENSSQAAYLLPHAMQGAATIHPGVVPLTPQTPLAGDPPPLKRPPHSPTNTYCAKRRRGRPPKISGEESDCEVGSMAGSLSAAEGDDTRSEADVKVELEESREAQHHIDIEETNHREHPETKSGESTPGPSGESKDAVIRQTSVEDLSDHAPRASPGSEWRAGEIRPLGPPKHLPPPHPSRNFRRGMTRTFLRGNHPYEQQQALSLGREIDYIYNSKLQAGASSSEDGDDLSRVLSSPPIGSLSSSISPSASSLVLSQGVSLLQTGVGLSSLGMAGMVGLGGMMGFGQNSTLSSSLNIDLPERSLMSAEDASSGVQMGIKVRGLDLMRYGRLEDGVYKCSECEKIQIPKTFKTSYSFQRHAYLYHEGRPKRFPCPVCGKEFSRPDKRKSHLKEKHGLFNSESSEQPEFRL